MSRRAKVLVHVKVVRLLCDHRTLHGRGTDDQGWGVIRTNEVPGEVIEQHFRRKDAYRAARKLNKKATPP